MGVAEKRKETKFCEGGDGDGRTISGADIVLKRGERAIDSGCSMLAASTGTAGMGSTDNARVVIAILSTTDDATDASVMIESGEFINRHPPSAALRQGLFSSAWFSFLPGKNPGKNPQKSSRSSWFLGTPGNIPTDLSYLPII